MSPRLARPADAGAGAGVTTPAIGTSIVTARAGVAAPNPSGDTSTPLRRANSPTGCTAAASFSR